MNRRLKLLSVFIVSLILAGCGTFRTASVPSGDWTSESSHIMSVYRVWQGTPYQWGGRSRKGIDCSAFTQRVFSDLYRTQLARTTDQQSKQGRAVQSGELMPGDLVFFKTGWQSRHVGIYIGQGDFIHASQSKGVTRSSLNNPYWSKRYWMSRRIDR